MAYDEAKWVVDHVKQFGVGFTVQHMRQMSAEQIAKDKVALRFLEPTNTMLEGQIMVEVKGVKILMKEGAYPRNRGDGVLVADNTDLGAYETEPLVVSGLQAGKYCFAAFPYSTIGQYDESGVDANHVEQIVHDEGTVTVTVDVDDDTFFTYSTVTLHNVTKGTTEEKTVAAGKNITFFAVEHGNTYYVSASDVERYMTPADTEPFSIVRDVEKVVTLTYEITKDLNSLPWWKIAEYAESGKAAQIFEIGDTKDFTLTTGEQCKAVILDFNHDPLASDTSKTAGITFGMLNCLEKTNVMNSRDTNVGGYAGSEMFTTVTTAFYNKLPEDMKPHIKKVRKKESAGSKSSTIKSFDVFAFLLAEIEVSNKTNTSYQGEGTFYPYFATIEKRIKKKGESGSKWFWWLRSPTSDSSTRFCYVDSDGTLGVSYASNGFGLSAGFCV